MKAAQKDQKFNSGLVSLWDPYFGTRMVFCLSTILRKVKPLLDRLSAEIKKKWSHMQKKDVLFHQDNAPCHKTMKTMVKLNELSFELLPHPPYKYSPDNCIIIII